MYSTVKRDDLHSIHLPPVTISQIPLSTLKGFILQLFSTRWNSISSQTNIFKFSDFKKTLFKLFAAAATEVWPLTIGDFNYEIPKDISNIHSPAAAKIYHFIKFLFKISGFLHFLRCKQYFSHPVSTAYCSWIICTTLTKEMSIGLFFSTWPRNWTKMQIPVLLHLVYSLLTAFIDYLYLQNFNQINFY